MQLRGIRGPLSGQSFDFEPEYRYVLGREPQARGDDFLIELPSPTVSSEHAEIFFENNSWMIRDLNSRNGIRVNRNKILEAYLTVGDIIDLGEFRFEWAESSALDSTSFTPTPRATAAHAQAVQERLTTSTFVEEGANDQEEYSSFDGSEKHSLLKKGLARFEKMDFGRRTLILSILFGLVLHFFVATPFLQESKKRIFKESFRTARAIAENLGQYYRAEMGQRQYELIDCEVYHDQMLQNFPNTNIPDLYLINLQGQVVCPLGKVASATSLLEVAQRSFQAVDNCQALLEKDEVGRCSLIRPIRYRGAESATAELVGFARIDYVPFEAYEAMKKLQSLRWQTLLVVLAILIGLIVMVRLWQRKAIKKLSDEVHLLYTGTAQKVEPLQSFSAFDELVEEINGLFSKVDQSTYDASLQNAGEASFLQPLIQQIFLLEERPILAVDHDNVVLGMSSFVPEVIPIEDEPSGRHVTEVVLDSHLQGEMMGLLNDLSMGSDVIDRALSLSDRVVQVRAMPLFLNGEYRASLLIF